MWTGKGRSGIGDTNIQGTWEDFEETLKEHLDSPQK